MGSMGTGVVLGSHSVKVVQARRKGGLIHLIRVANVKLDAETAERPLDAEKVEQLAAILSRSVKRGGRTALGLTGRDLIVRYTHVPPVPDWRLEMLMKFEIEEVSEQSGGEVSADWVRLDLPETASADNTVLVALTKNAALTPRISVLEKAGLNLRGACPNAVAFFHAFVKTSSFKDEEVVLLMHIGAENTDIAIQQGGKLIFARNVSGGGRLFTEAVVNQFPGTAFDRADRMKQQKADVTPKSTAKYPDSLAEKVSNAVLGVTGQFVSMVHSSVMFCKAQTKLKELNVNRVVLAGGGANLKGFREYMEANAGLPVSIFDPTESADVSGLDPKEAEVFAKDPSGLTVALGLALMALEGGPLTVEILPESLRKRQRIMEREIYMVGAGLAVLALIVMLFLTASRDHGAATREVETLKARITAGNEQKREYDRVKAQYEAAEAKWELLREKVGTGPGVARALAMTNAVIRGKGYDEIHVTSVKAETFVKTGEKAPDAARDARGPAQVRVRVFFTASIQQLRRAPSEVFSDFERDLRAEAGGQPGAVVEAKAPKPDNSFDFSFEFAPVD